MLQETWERWEPIATQIEECCAIDFIDTEDYFKIFVEIDSYKAFEIIFKQPLCFYRVTIEICTIQRVSSLKHQYGNLFDPRWIFFKIKNSSLMHDLGIDTSTGFLEKKPTHFAIIDTESVTDIVSADEPEIRWL